MTATVETSIKYDLTLSLKKSGELANVTFRMFNLILALIELSKNEGELRQSMEVMKSHTEPYFAFGYGSNHMWVHQKMGDKVSSTRLLIVRFD